MSVWGEGQYVEVSVTPTVDTDAYSDGDVVGGLLTFAIDPIYSGVRLNRVVVIDESAQEAVFRLHLYESQPSTIADDAAFALSDADALLWRGSVALTGYTSFTVSSVANVADIDDVYLPDDSGNLYGYLELNGSTPTYAADDDLTIVLYFSSR